MARPPPAVQRMARGRHMVLSVLRKHAGVRQPGCGRRGHEVDFAVDRRQGSGDGGLPDHPDVCRRGFVCRLRGNHPRKWRSRPHTRAHPAGVRRRLCRLVGGMHGTGRARQRAGLGRGTQNPGRVPTDYGWSQAKAQELLELLERKRLAEVDRHMHPWLVRFLHPSTALWNRLYEEFL